MGTTRTTRKATAKPASSSRATRNASRPKAATIGTVGSKAFFDNVAKLGGFDGAQVQDAGDGETFVLVITTKGLTWTVLADPRSRKFEVEVSSDQATDDGPPDHHVLSAITATDTALAGELVRLVHGEPDAKPEKAAAPKPEKATSPKVAAPKPATGKRMTMKEYQEQVKRIDGSDMDSRHKAAAKAVLTKQGREAGLTIAGSRKPTATMSRDEISARRSDAAKRAVATRKANEAEAKKAAEAKPTRRARKTA